MASYKIVEELGRGGMGVVYRALHPALNREVAIKFLLGDSGAIAEVTRSRFRREMDVLMRLSHPSIIKVYDAGEADERLYYVMELLQARDLQWHLRRRGHLPVDVVVAVLDQLLDALEYIHGSGVVHRDIKPSNIVLEDSGRAILMDFGVVHQAGATLLTQEGHAVGTPRYFSPEMILRGESSPASDQFSLGVVAYELLTNVAPFDGDSLPAVAHAIMKVDHVPLPERRREIPASVSQVIDRMLAKKPESRWPSCGAAREALQAAVIAWEEAPSKLLESSIIPLPPAPAATRPTAKRAVPVAPRMLVPKHSLQNDAAARRFRIWAAASLMVALAIVVPLGRWLLRGRGAGTGPVVIAVDAVPRASEVTVRRVKPDLLLVEFQSAVPSSWALDRGRGPEAREASAVTDHALELKTSPWEAEESLALVSGARRVELAPPLTLSELVHRLRSATRARELSPAAVEKVWVAIRTDLVKTVSHINAKIFRAALEKAPATRKRFDEHVEMVRRARNLGDTLKLLAPHVATLLSSNDTPAALRTELLEALWAIDRTDALASWLAVPAPFGVQRMMAPALEITAELSGDLPPSPARRFPLEISPDPTGVVLVLKNEVPESNNPLMKLGDTMLLMRSATRGRRHAYTASFSNADAPVAQTRRFHIEAQALDPNVWLLLQPPGLDVPLAVRVPDAMAPSPSDHIWLTLTVRGALAGVRGAWQMSQARAFEEISRIYVIVDRVLEEELP